MNTKLQSILEKFILGESLSGSDLNEIRRLFNDRNKREEIDQWLSCKWENAGFDDVGISYDGLKQKIQEYEKPAAGHKIYRHVVRFSRYYQRIAAILFIPLILGLSCYLFFAPSGDENFYISEAPLGQKARIELPDGSRVWLNSGSSIRYSSGFNQKNREIELKGEAFFDVQKNKGKPFLVHTPFLDVEVTGTRFNVNAYDDEPLVETALVEGKVNLILKDQHENVQLDPGKVLSYSKATHEVSSSTLNKEATISWKENRLIFINDDFSRLVRKMEKWYDVEVICNPDDFKNNKLTVRLLEGEQLNQLLDIIETAIGAECTMKKNKIYITKN